MNARATIGRHQCPTCHEPRLVLHNVDYCRNHAHVIISCADCQDAYYARLDYHTYARFIEAQDNATQEFYELGATLETVVQEDWTKNFINALTHDHITPGDF